MIETGGKSGVLRQPRVSDEAATFPIRPSQVLSALSLKSVHGRSSGFAAQPATLENPELCARCQPRHITKRYCRIEKITHRKPEMIPDIREYQSGSRRENGLDSACKSLTGFQRLRRKLTRLRAFRLRKLVRHSRIIPLLRTQDVGFVTNSRCTPTPTRD